MFPVNITQSYVLFLVNRLNRIKYRDYRIRQIIVLSYYDLNKLRRIYPDELIHQMLPHHSTRGGVGGEHYEEI